jgi:tetratricopeptide (TPR) repeat protein
MEPLDVIYDVFMNEERPVNSESKTSDKGFIGLKPTYIPRLMPVGMIIILLAILIPVLREGKRGPGRLDRPEAPIAMNHYSTGFATTDSLLNEAIRCFDRRDYAQAAHILTKVYFFWNASIGEGRMETYPEDLRFYLGLSEFYRGRPDRAAPYLEEEERANPGEGKYPWYLAHAYDAVGDHAKARAELEKVVRIGDRLAVEAVRKLQQLPAPADSSTGSQQQRPR